MDAFWRNLLGVGFQALRHPVMAQTVLYENGQRQAWHVHEQPQLFYALSGALKVLTSEGIRTLPPYKAIWIPSGLGHEIHTVGDVEARSVLFESKVTGALWRDTRAVSVKGLLDELIGTLIRISGLPDESDPETTEYRHMLIPMILRTLERAENTREGGLPLPSDRRLRGICAELLLEPALSRTLEHYADIVGASTRTLARLFRSETGLSFVEWRQQLRIVEAVSRLLEGHSIASISYDLGYQSPSSFTAMFKRVMGMPPQRYLAAESE